MKGKLTPFADAREFSLNLALNDIDLPYYLAYLPVELPIELHNGRLGFDLQLLYRASMAQQPEFLISGEVNLTALNVWDRQGEQLFFLPLLRAVIAPSKPLEQDIQLASLDLYNLEVNVSRDRNGEWNHARLKMAEADAGTEETAPAEDAAETAFKLAVNQFRLRDAILFFRDDLPAGGFETTARYA
jgi:hypothetical protein